MGPKTRSAAPDPTIVPLHAGVARTPLLWEGCRMEIQLTGRGVRLTQALRATVDEKCAKLQHWDPKVGRIQVEVSKSADHHLHKVKRVDLVVDIPKETFRAHGESAAIETAVEQAVERAGRQMKERKHKQRRAVVHGAGRVKSGQRAPATDGRKA